MKKVLGWFMMVAGIFSVFTLTFYCFFLWLTACINWMSSVFEGVWGKIAGVVAAFVFSPGFFFFPIVSKVVDGVWPVNYIVSLVGIIASIIVFAVGGVINDD